MAIIATFDPTLSTERDRMRAFFGDTIPTTALLDDATIDAVIAKAATLPLAGLELCDMYDSAYTVRATAQDGVFTAAELQPRQATIQALRRRFQDEVERTSSLAAKKPPSGSMATDVVW